MADANAQFVERIMAWSDVLDQLDYYQLLEVDTKASLGQIRKAYHAQTRLFHPDRYFHLKDERLKQVIYRISKRVTEAYVCLRNPAQRGHYDVQLAQTERAKLRFTEESAQDQKKEKLEQTGKTEKGRQLHRQGMAEMKRKAFEAAERTFKMAMAYEPDNDLFKKLAEEASHSIKTNYVVK